MVSLSISFISFLCAPTYASVHRHPPSVTPLTSFSRRALSLKSYTHRKTVVSSTIIASRLLRQLFSFVYTNVTAILYLYIVFFVLGQFRLTDIIHLFDSSPLCLPPTSERTLQKNYFSSMRRVERAPIKIDTKIGDPGVTSLPFRSANSILQELCVHSSQ